MEEKPKHPGSENLRPAQPGEVRNPNGRPKGSRNRGTLLKRFLALPHKDENGKTMAQPDGSPGTVTIEEMIELRLIKAALDGDLPAIKEIKDTIHGRIPLKQEFSGPEGDAIPVANVTNDVLSMLTKEQLQALRDKHTKAAEQNKQ